MNFKEFIMLNERVFTTLVSKVQTYRDVGDKYPVYINPTYSECKLFTHQYRAFCDKQGDMFAWSEEMGSHNRVCAELGETPLYCGFTIKYYPFDDSFLIASSAFGIINNPKQTIEYLKNNPNFIRATNNKADFSYMS